MPEILTTRDLIYLVLSYLHGAWRHRWNMMAVAWFVCLSGWAAVHTMQDQYISQAAILIEDPQGKVAPFIKEMTVAFDVTVEARRILSGLINRDNLVSVLRNSDLSASINDQQDLEIMLESLRAQVQVKPATPNSTTYYITHRYTNPKVSYQVVKGLTDILMQGAIQKSNAEGPQSAESFLNEQITEYQGKLEDLDLRLQEFKHRNAQLLGEDVGYYKRLKELGRQLTDERNKMRELERKREALRLQMEEFSGAPLPDPGANASAAASAANAASYEQRIQELEAKLEEVQAQFYMKGERKVLVYPDDHREVIALRQKIAALKQKKSVPLPRATPQREDPLQWERDNDPVHKQVKLALSEVEVSLASIRSRVETIEKQVDELKAIESALPAVEAEILRMERDRGNTKEKLEQLMKRRSEAEFSGHIASKMGEKVKFKLLSKPVLPSRPLGPNRPLFLTMVLMGGLLSGIMTAVMMAILRPVFDSPGSLKKVLGLPVLGMVSMFDDGSGRRWNDSGAAFFFALLALLGVFGVVIAPHLM
ncbi:MAG: hypothetical protein HQL51_02455 [Magnetococcales bacterium]|nr:hypothetical protein [Magnetococcales bacterium]